MRHIAQVLALSLLASCSFTTAGSFKECSSHSDCSSRGACAQGYCLPLPNGCAQEQAGEKNSPFAQQKVIPLVALVPLTTPTGTDDAKTQAVNAIKLAIEEVNPQLGDRGVFGLFVCDTKVADGDAMKQGNWFIENLNAPSLLVFSSDPTRALAQSEVRKSAGTLLISPNATSPALSVSFMTEGNVWRVPPPDTLQAKVMVDLLSQTFPDAATSDAGVAVLHPKDDYGAGFANPLVDGLRNKGFNAIRVGFDTLTTSSYSAAVTGLKNHQPRATVLIGSAVDIVPILNLAKTTPLLAHANGHQWFLTDSTKEAAIINAELEGALGTAPAQGAGLTYGSFRDGFIARFNVDPTQTKYASHSYDATWLLMLAAQYAQGNSTDVSVITGAKMAEGFRKMSNAALMPASQLRANEWMKLQAMMIQGTDINVLGASGPLDFNLETGAALSPYEIWQISGGAIRFARFVDP